MYNTSIFVVRTFYLFNRQYSSYIIIILNFWLQQFKLVQITKNNNIFI